jgi:CHAD domain-containing protein
MAHATTTIAGVLASRMGEAIDLIAARLPAAKGGDRGAVHRARVASRRLREALALAAAVLPDTDAARTRREVRRLTRALGPVREADVTLQTLAAASERHGWRRTGAAAVRRRLDAERTRRRRRMTAKLDALDMDAMQARIADVAAVLEQAQPSDEWSRALGARLARRAAELLRAVKQCGTLYAPDRLHAVRIAVKKLRYALEIAGAADVLESEADLTALHQAQESFGELHDLQMLLGGAQAAAGAVRRTAMGEIIGSIVTALERDCRERHAEALTVLPRLADRAASIRRAAAVLRARRTMIKLETAGEAGAAGASTGRLAAGRRDRRGARQGSVG